MVLTEYCHTGAEDRTSNGSLHAVRNAADRFRVYGHVLSVPTVRCDTYIGNLVRMDIQA